MKLRSSKAIESNSKSDDNTDIYDEINADKQNDSINNGLEIELKSDTSDTVRSYNCRKLNDIEIDLLKAYLNENIFIHSTEAKSRLEKETGIEAGVYSVSQKLRFLKKKMVKEYAKQRLAITESGKKVKRFHLEHLKKYLRENSSIEPSEARDRLQKDTGLKVHITTANKHLNLLKEGIGSGRDKLDMIRSNSTEALTKFIYEYELSNTHIEYLKKLLKEDNYIESVEARNRIQEEMDEFKKAKERNGFRMH
ncbi:hypothetical protein CONCODRAFT_71454 [Conidiobolus coronatus NRRL 28638]|uniref:Uncharacterized protein n=1 Tax=Conidiobolus coronatus (strain ATCC 28846 / CBS 209.66 / NRRL 28638) TaxID=796925 RepID=A0A137P382_CONC2|nr:hypothetical protein CONCODRAFT_71454 [Conidiobolus coronatus NRRL 28638]|eukprot:KXN69480.1 hypothetical protein CONCODRAFT_71454 [Conidiobolus coronatus NRRL 28638]